MSGKATDAGRRIWRCPQCGRRYKILIDASTPKMCPECKKSQSAHSANRVESVRISQKKPLARKGWTIAFVISLVFNALFLVLLITTFRSDRVENQTPASPSKSNPQLVALEKRNKQLTQQLEENEREVTRLQSLLRVVVDKQDTTDSKEGKADPATSNPQFVALERRNKQLTQQLEENNREITRLQSLLRAVVDKQSATDSKKRKTDPRGAAEVGTPAGNGLFHRNVSMRREDFGGFRVVGEMVNRSGGSYQIATFVMSVYDQEGKLLDTSPILISNFENHQTKSFDTHFLKTSVSAVETYKIQFENGF